METSMINFPSYNYKGAGTLIQLHDSHLRSFFRTWKRAKEVVVNLPKTNDPDYANMEALLHHVLRSSKGYIVWICNNLELNDPEIKPVPAIEEIEEDAERYLDHLLDRYRLPLADISEELFFNKVYKSKWDVDYCIEAMLEHAVMHPIRHEFQLKKLIEESF